MINNRTNKPRLQTFHSLTFHHRGQYNKGCEAVATIRPNVRVRVSGGVYDNGADGSSSYDVELINNTGLALNVRGYRTPLRAVTCDDVTCFMLHVQRARPTQIRTKRQQVASS